jgi:surface antigen
MRGLLAAPLALLLLAGCAGPNQTAGTLIGAGAGALVGNQFGHGSGKVAATAGGAVLGGLLGSNIGAQADRAYYRGPQTQAYYAPPPPPPPAYYYRPRYYYYGY